MHASDDVLKHLPRGRKLPARFDAFLRLSLPFAVRWNDLDAYGLKSSATEQIVPFLRLPDGGMVALWYHAASPAVVHVGGHGERQVVARDFDNFLRAINSRQTGLGDFDECDPGLRVPGVRGTPVTDDMAALQKSFRAWCKRNSALQRPMRTPEAEALRRRVMGIAEDMIRDGRCRVYTLASSWWSMGFQIACNGPQLSITYLDYGVWYPLPTEYDLVPVVRELLALSPHVARRRYNLDVCSAGIVSIDRDRIMALRPPAKKQAKQK